MERDFKHWNGLSREVIRSPCLEVQEMIVCSTLFHALVDKMMAKV